MIIPPTFAEHAGSLAQADRPAASGQALQSAYVPTKTAAGGVFMIVEKDTGRVIVELPGPPPPAVDRAGAPAAHLVDLQI